MNEAFYINIKLAGVFIFTRWVFEIFRSV